MNILFEIADRDLMIIGAILVVIFIVAAVIFRAIINKNRVMPIGEDERFDNEDNFEEEVKEEKEEKTLTDEQIKAKDELARVYAQMSMDLEKQEEIQEEKVEEKDNIDEFEREQEENAIISYQELMAAAEKLKKQADRYEAHIEDNADVKVHEAMNTYKEHTEKTVKPEVKKEEYHGFKNSDIISPIYGIQKEKKKSSPKRQSDGIINRAYEKASAESEQNMDFLNSLKEFRKNL